MHLESSTAYPGARREAMLARDILHRLFAGFPHGMSIRLWTGDLLHIGEGPARFTMQLRRPGILSDVVLGGGVIALAESYFNSEIELAGDIYSVLGIKDHLESRLDLRDQLALFFRALQLKLKLKRHSGTAPSDQVPAHEPVRHHRRSENRSAVAFHYDVSNDFYKLWLDERMVYSCAYFESPGDTLEQAQINKLDLICRKLRLQPRDRMLDIGCGWGALVMHAAQHYGVKAHGITVSRRQFELARHRIDEAGLGARASVALADYRDLPGEGCFDKIASVGMFEHVGLKNLPLYFSVVHRLLAPRGLFLNHGISHDEEGWRQEDLSSRFINRFVFPDGQLDRISSVLRHTEAQRFEIWDVENLRPHYGMTLRHWVSRLEDRHREALDHVNETIYRIWRIYMAACALEFESGHVGVYQVLASKQGDTAVPLPLTRRDLYEAPAPG